MTSLCFILLLAQLFNPNSHSVSRLSEREKAALRDAAATGWRSVGGSNHWILPLTAWEMHPEGRKRPLTNWIRISGRTRPEGKNLLVYQDIGRQPPVLVLTNLPPERHRDNRVNAYGFARGQVYVRLHAGAPVQVPFYDFGKIIDPPGRTNSVANATRQIGTNSVRRTERRTESYTREWRVIRR